MNVIKVNFDNAYVKKPKQLYPNVHVYKYNKIVSGTVVKILRLEVLPRLEEEPFYTNFVFDISLNDTPIARIKPNSYHEGNKYIVEFTDRSFLLAEFFIVKFDGEYNNEIGYQQLVTGWTKKIYTSPYCGEEVVCSEKTYVSEYINGTYVYGFFNSSDEKFYFDRATSLDGLGNVVYTYTNEVNTDLLGEVIQSKIFVDASTLVEYTWNSLTDKFVPVE